ncbi:hypothetical protein TrispH2_001638 [Trichoplax sp. H2]|uniref:Uncharacterized protein n=1 Tax=Trichoplax adhaerens TaxID=10228 RepID=B3RVR4_TRIAD|nr:predicted protein [Trichoplax adhaerens]EDV26040.1 predicted protein [Trichoplax adhaerens]RDD46914.1 hypothetical protein TrispH2_001638 [Trichoplax sp. H2]|eukprot:XP_002112073.1 predicted protein [Trichoplax adhaerens]
MAEQIYQEDSRRKKLARRLTILLTLCSCILALVFCGIKSATNPNVNFLTANLVISSLLALVIVFWYYRGIIGSEKSWYIWFICFLFLFQSITIDIFVWHHAPKSNSTVHPTHSMPTTMNPHHTGHHGNTTGHATGTAATGTGTPAAGTGTHAAHTTHGR